LEEALALTEEGGSVEIGSILLGRLHRDAGAGEAFLEITAQIPARHTVAESMKITFTAATWTAVQAAIDLTRQGEQIVGWFHSHPAKFWCNPKCPPAARRHCPLTRAHSFLSTQDRALHRAVFAKAYCVALVVTNAEAGLEIALFAWKNALLTQRGFHILQTH